ncbi:MAG: hypothetical protein IKU23_06490, partial [Clostridia bacterium]|nr:hypothetical protein [Clostridia bacterium]
VAVSNGYWQELPKTDNVLSYRYQLRTDGTKLYVALQADCDLVVGGNGTGTNLRFWINTNEDATVYTHFYDLNAVGTGAKYNTSTTSNSGANIQNSSMQGVVVGENGKTNFEFSVNLSEFNGTNGFYYYIAFSNFMGGENICLYYPPVTEGAARADNLPYKNWDRVNQGVFDIASAKLGEATTATAPRLTFVSYDVDRTTSYKYWNESDADRFKDDGIRLINGIKSTSDGWSPEYSAWKKAAHQIVDIDFKLQSSAYVEKVVAYVAGGTAGISAPEAMSISYSTDGVTYTPIAAEFKVKPLYLHPDSTSFSRYAYIIELPEAVLATHIRTSITISWGGMLWIDEVEAYGELNIHTHQDTDGKWETDGTYHYHTCGCGTIFDKTAHFGGEATCKDKAICSVCNKEYGSVDSNNHVGETYVEDAVTEDCGNDGYTGDTYCKDCDTLLEEGETIPATGNHTGGTATCKDKAVCTVCGQSYGSLNADNHVGETYVKDYLKETCGNDGYTGDTYCSDCDTLLEEGETIP